MLKQTIRCCVPCPPLKQLFGSITHHQLHNSKTLSRVFLFLYEMGESALRYSMKHISKYRQNTTELHERKWAIVSGTTEAQVQLRQYTLQQQIVMYLI